MMVAPKTALNPPVKPAEIMGPMNEKLVPWIHNSPQPTGPIRRHWMNVETPDANKDMETKKPVDSKSSFKAPAIINGGVIMATKIANKCWSAAKTVSFNGGRSFSP